MSTEQTISILANIGAFSSGVLLVSGLIQIFIESQRLRVMLGIWSAGVGLVGLVIGCLVMSQM